MQLNRAPGLSCYREGTKYGYLARERRRRPCGSGHCAMASPARSIQPSGTALYTAARSAPLTQDSCGGGKAAWLDNGRTRCQPSAYMDAPFAKHSFDDGEKVKIACIHPVFRAAIAADPDGIRRPVPDQCFEL